jgi:hypothetical protein
MSPHQRHHRGHEQCAGQPLQVGGENSHEEGNDNQADEQPRCAVIDRPAADTPASLEIAISACRGLRLGIHAWPRRLDAAGTVDHSRKPLRHYPKESGDTGEQEHRCDRELNGVGDDSSVRIERHGVTSMRVLRTRIADWARIAACIAGLHRIMRRRRRE